jgi:HAD superfamily phosphatase (TIGR01668 family)
MYWSREKEWMENSVSKKGPKRKIFKQWLPDAYYPAVKSIPLDKYYELGFRLILLDIDNTLAIHGSHESQSYAKENLDYMRSLGFRVIVLSNALEERARRFGHSLDPDLEVLGDARKPSAKGVYRALELTGLNKDQTLLIGDQLFTDVWCGTRAGVSVVLVDRLTSKEPWYIYLKRVGEIIVKGLSGMKQHYDTILG